MSNKNDQSPKEHPRFQLRILILCVTGALLSIWFQGFQFGISNNIFHIPYVLRLGENAQFANDAFYQSLNHFTSVIWPFLRLFTTEQNVWSIFLVAHIASRIFLFISVSMLLMSFGVKRLRWLFIAMVLLAATPLFMGASDVGVTGMLISYFTQTELSYPLILLAFLAWSRDRRKTAVAILGIVFDINAFVGVWCGLVVMFLLMRELSVTENLKGFFYNGLKLLLIFIVVGSPAIVWIALSTIGDHKAQYFDYIEFIQSYYPYHFLISAASMQAVGALLSMVLITLLTLKKAKFAQIWTHIYLGFILVFVLGVVLPYITHERLLINLHLLRVDGVLQLLSIVYLMAFLFRCDDLESWRRRPEKLIALVALGTGQWYLISLAFLLLHYPTAKLRHAVGVAGCLLLLIGLYLNSNSKDVIEAWLFLPLLFAAALEVSAQKHAWLGWLWLAAGLSGIGFVVNAGVFPLVALSSLSVFLMLGIIVYFALAKRGLLPLLMLKTNFPVVLMSVFFVLPALWYGYGIFETRDKLNNVEADWAALQGWVRNAALEGEFLIPLKIEGAKKVKDFQLEARVPVWVNWKQGAAVMWKPDFYEQWSPRYQEVGRLKDAADFYAYSCRRHIPFFVVQATGQLSFQFADALYRNGHFQLFKIRGDCRE